jgi:Capsule polysaccharide biosynthesis protein
MMNKKPVVLFFARGYQAEFFPTLQGERYTAVFVTLTRAERLRVERLGGHVAACFEEDFERLVPAPVAQGYMVTSFMSDRFLGRFDHPQRLEILGKEITFWSRLFDTHQPVAVVNELVAIEISEVLLIECQRRGIRYLAGMNCLVDDYFYWLRNPISLSGKYIASGPPSAQSVALARQYVQEVLAKDYKPFYVKNLSHRRALLPLGVAMVKMLLWQLRRLHSGSGRPFRYELYDEEYAKKVAVYFKSLVLSYDRLEDLPRDKEVIFFPLHQEPEATLNYMSEFFSNQVATIENILKCLSPNQVLVIKEHPVDKGSLLRRKFWDIRKRYSGLYYLPAELHGRQVLDRASRVVTLTSTVGWEAAVTGKPVYVLGQIFYDGLEGLTAVRNFDELKRELRSTAAADRLTLAVVEAFVARMTEQSYPGNPFPHPELYSTQNKARIVHAIADAAGL